MRTFAGLLVRSLVLIGIIHGIAPAPAWAQVAPADVPARIRPASAGDCEIVVQLLPARAGDHIGISVDLQPFPEQRVIGSPSELTFAVPTLRLGSPVHLFRNGQDVQQVVVEPLPPRTNPRGVCPAEAAASATQVSFDATAYVGTVVDTFAPDSIGNYKNPEGGTAQKMRDIFGVNFDLRLWGHDESPLQLWVFGETLHGVRSADVDCTKDPAPICSSSDVTFADRARYIIKHASSLEASINPRLEFATLQKHSTTPTRLYVTARIGFISLERAPSVFKSLHTGVGLLAADGKFRGSYVEAGIGKNELFSADGWKRVKIDGLLSFGMQKIPMVGEAMRGFVQMYIDNDMRGGGADSVQTLFGVDVAIGALGDE